VPLPTSRVDPLGPPRHLSACVPACPSACPASGRKPTRTTPRSRHHVHRRARSSPEPAEAASPESERLEAELARKEAELAELRARLARWEEVRSGSGAGCSFTTISGGKSGPSTPRWTGPNAEDYLDGIGLPGEYPFTRGPYGTMYRTRLWTMRQFAGFATAEETNERYHYLLRNGQTGLSVAFDFPTLMGYDSDHPRSLGEVGVCGVAISSLADMETLFDGIPLDKVSVSMTINGPAIILFCFYVAAAEKQGVSPDQLRGTVQNDILKEYQAQHAWVFPPEPALRAIVDMFEWCAEHAPKYNPISSRATTSARRGHRRTGARLHPSKRLRVRGAGDRPGARRGRLRPPPLLLLRHPQRLLRGDREAPGRSPHLGPDAAGEVRREEPRVLAPPDPLPDRGGDPHGQQPENNIARVAYQAMAAVLGGPSPSTRTRWTRPWPSPRRRRSASRSGPSRSWPTRPGWRTPSIPWPGSYYVESLTDELEAEAEELFARIDEVGAWSPGSRPGGSRRRSRTRPCGSRSRSRVRERLIVGVNAFTDGGDKVEIDTLRIDPSVEERQRERMARLRSRAGRRCGAAHPLRPHRGGPVRREPGPPDPGLRPGLLHPLRDPLRHGGGLRSLPRAGLLLRCSAPGPSSPPGASAP
jgi:methylmalonyl-CoA mutase, N-terminal domain